MGREEWLWKREQEFIIRTFGGFHIKALNELLMLMKFCAVTHFLNFIALVIAEPFTYHEGPISDLFAIVLK